MAAAQKTRKARRDMYAETTALVLDALANGQIPWERPWNGSTDAPRSIHGRPYRGYNAMLLGFLRQTRGYSSSYWITYKQAEQRGGHVRKGEKGTTVILWKWIDKTDEETGEQKRIPFLTSFTVFNLDQVEGVAAPAQDEVAEFDPIDRAEEILAGMPNRPRLGFGGDRAYYHPQLDMVQLPEREQFKTREGFYFTAYHELAHSTGHESRIGRKAITDHKGAFGDESYAQEELVAEFAAAFVGAEAGITEAREIDNRAAYIDNWMQALRSDEKMLVRAAAQAQKAADFILGHQADDGKGE